MFAFVALAGVRQGCPLSSTIFVIVTDCICSALIERLGPGSLLRMYSDDICISYKDFCSCAARIARTFDVVGRVSCLYLNGKKCVIVPVRKLTHDFVKTWVKVQVTLWRDFKVCSCAKYLGFLIGPGAGDQDWARVLDKICHTSKFIKGLGLPRFFVFSLFQMFGVSQLQFVAQLRVPSKTINGVDVRVVRDLIGGPGLWAPCCLFRNFKSAGFPIEIQLLRAPHAPQWPELDLLPSSRTSPWLVALTAASNMFRPYSFTPIRSGETLVRCSRYKGLLRTSPTVTS